MASLTERLTFCLLTAAASVPDKLDEHVWDSYKAVQVDRLRLQHLPGRSNNCFRNNKGLQVGSALRQGIPFPHVHAENPFNQQSHILTHFLYDNRSNGTRKHALAASKQFVSEGSRNHERHCSAPHTMRFWLFHLFDGIKDFNRSFRRAQKYFIKVRIGPLT